MARRLLRTAATRHSKHFLHSRLVWLPRRSPSHTGGLRGLCERMPSAPMAQQECPQHTPAVPTFPSGECGRSNPSTQRSRSGRGPARAVPQQLARAVVDAVSVPRCPLAAPGTARRCTQAEPPPSCPGTILGSGIAEHSPAGQGASTSRNSSASPS